MASCGFQQQEKMEESYLQKFTSMATSGASLRDLEMLTESYESEMAALNETHLLERNQASQRLMKALNILALQNLDKLWNQVVVGSMRTDESPSCRVFVNS